MSEKQTVDLHGLVFNIQRYSLHDGPGIRTTVFLKGCPLACIWCCNPESQNAWPELAYLKDKCIGCLRCVELCPYKAIDATPDGLETDWSICERECHRNGSYPFPCMLKCYGKARDIMGRLMTVDEVMGEIMKDAEAYRESGGGLTVSGGEPMSQVPFLKSLFSSAKENYLNIAMETCGFASWRSYEAVLGYIDYLYLDIKYFDDGMHRRNTGRSNELILKNAPRMADLFRKKGGVLVVRTPIIPGLSDPGDLAAIADFVRGEMSGVTTLELMPYHRLGRGKYGDIGREYSLEAVRPPNDQEMKPFQDIVASRGLNYR